MPIERITNTNRRALKGSWTVENYREAFCLRKSQWLVLVITELTLWKPSYHLTDFSASEVLSNHESVLTPFGIETSDENLDLPYIYWISKMHKNPYKHRFVAGSSKYSTKPLSILLTKLLTHIKQGLQKYCETAYSKVGFISCGSLRIPRSY